MVLSQLQLQSLLVKEVFNVGIGVFGVSIILSWGSQSLAQVEPRVHVAVVKRTRFRSREGAR